AADRGGPKQSDGQGGTRWVVSIMGGHDKRGRWRPAPRCTVLNIMGGSDIDLNDAELPGPLTELRMRRDSPSGCAEDPHTPGVDHGRVRRGSRSQKDKSGTTARTRAAPGAPARSRGVTRVGGIARSGRRAAPAAAAT
ncbi:MAG: hypothetical protein ACXVFI_17670, partial [Solirubrobacteraceae bacterium]